MEWEYNRRKKYYKSPSRRRGIAQYEIGRLGNRKFELLVIPEIGLHETIGEFKKLRCAKLVAELLENG